MGNGAQDYQYDEGGGEFPPYKEDYFQRITAVNWTTGLAVEFNPSTNLKANQGLSGTDRAVISFWFKVPSSAIAAVQAAAAGKAPNQLVGVYRTFIGIVPVLTWGSQQQVTITEVSPYDSGAMYWSGGIIILDKITGTHIEPMAPSYIGLRVGGTDWAVNPPGLEINIQTNVQPHCSGISSMATDFTGNPQGTYPYPPYAGRPQYSDVVITSVDISDLEWGNNYEYVGNVATSVGPGLPPVTLDKWHHIILSWRLVSCFNATGGPYCQMWCALDDVNLKGNNLPALQGDGYGPNDTKPITPWVWEGADTEGRFASASFDGSSVPFDPMQIPAAMSVQYVSDSQGSTANKNPIATVEVAELQIFAGLTLDTGVVGNRRAFIDNNGKPVDPKQAQKLLGKKPDILLHGSGNWIKGKNTGSDGQFTPTGKIKRYTPDPQLGK